MYEATEFPQEVFRKVMDINVMGSFLIAKHMARTMRDTRASGSIVIVAPMAGYVCIRVRFRLVTT